MKRIIKFISSLAGKRRDRPSSKIYEKYFKRPLDFLLAFLMLTCLSPVLVAIALVVRVKLGAPVIFSQERIGMNGKSFKVYKFRTMTEKKGRDGTLLSDKERLTDFGKKLRSSSLDELPELLNILVGDMSFVGPRPLIIEYAPYYTKEEQHRHDVRPGLTGLAQVNGRSFISWEEIFFYDLQYVNKVTFKNDFKIILKTIFKVLKKENIVDASSAGQDKDGKWYVYADGRKIWLHQPLNVERNNSSINREEEINVGRKED